ncbi:MAG: EAL domain-containing protein [Elainellaceae cyanobacterium]
MCAPVIECEAARLEALYQYQVLDTAPEPEFDDLTQLAAYICNTPIALVSLIDHHRQWFKAKVGLTVSETHRDLAFCTHAILQSEPFIVENATLDYRFVTNPLVTGEPHIRFYAGFPLMTPAGYYIGTLCVIDRIPRQLSLGQIRAMRALSRQVMSQLELRRSHAEIKRAIAHDFNHYNQLNNALQQSLRELTDIKFSLDQSSIVTITDTKGAITYANSKFCKIFQFSQNELIGQNHRIVNSGFHSKTFFRQMWATISQGRVWQGELKNRAKDGTLYWVDVTIVPLLHDGKPDQYIAVYTDITERKQLEDLLKWQSKRERYQALHDQLTELPNRQLFHQRLTLALAHIRQHEEMLAVMFLNLDRFKLINDTLGYAVGDRVLQQVAQRIAKCLKPTDTIARWGGDEFILILPHLHSAEDITKVAQCILKSFEACFELEQQELHITASIGIALAPYDGEDGETLLKNAGAAMYHVKQRGRNGFQIYASDMDIQTFDQLILVNDLYKALERSEFLLHYQPQVNLQTGEIVALEALVRWQHPQRGLVPPNQFIAIAEETGQINAIGGWVLQSACAQNRAWQRAGLPPVRVAVNLSGRQFQPNLTRLITQVLSDTGLEPQYLEIEITETIAMQDLALTISLLKELQEIGVYISIDDFGTGYSSLAMLKQFPLHTLKIDREFIKDLSTSSRDAAVIQSIVALGHSLNLEVVAEGVETLEQWNFLQSIRCNAMQGYFLSKPLSVEAISPFISRRFKNIPVKYSDPF